MSKKEVTLTERERSFEFGLPDYLQHDLNEFKIGLKNNSSILDCLWDELYGSINMAEISDGIITSEQNGANGKKIAIEYDGEQYMFKFPPSADNKPTTLSYK